MASDPRPAKPADERTPKKPYQSPDLRVYGDIAAITRAGTNSGTGDNRSGGGNRTT
jgi:hypothetical protein